MAFSFIAGEVLQRITAGRGVLLSGVEYLLIGAVLGPLGLRFLGPEVLGVMRPGVWLLEGFIGFILGLPLRDGLRRAGWRRFAGAMVHGALSTAAIGGVGFGLLWVLRPGSTVWELLLPAAVLGAAGSVASGRLLGMASESLGARGPVTELLSVTTMVSTALAVVVTGLVMDWRRAQTTSILLDMGLPRELWLASSVAVGAACGVLFVLFHRNEDNDERTFLATVGVVIFASGIASAIGSSPLLVGLVAGVAVSALSPQARDLAGRLALLERPAVIALLLFAGARWLPLESAQWLMAVVYVVVRAVWFWVATDLTLRPLLPHRVHGHLGAGLRSQGVYPVALAVSLDLAYPEHAAVTHAILVGVLVFEPGAGAALRRLLGDAGELGLVTAGQDPRAEERT